MPVHATLSSKVSTSFQPKGGTNPIIERPLRCLPSSLPISYYLTFVCASNAATPEEFRMPLKVINL